jgi:hypothetical protein
MQAYVSHSLLFTGVFLHCHSPFGIQDLLNMVDVADEQQ